MKPKQQHSSSKETNKVEKLPLVPIPLKAVGEIVIPSVKTWSEHHSPRSKDSHSLDPSLNSFLVRLSFSINDIHPYYFLVEC
jgi:hypothetical protein